MKLLLILICLCSISVIGQNTFVPDDNFEQALIDFGYDAGPLDDLVPTQNIENIDNLSINGRGIIDLTGIEDFVGLTSFNADDNNLTSVDLSGNVNIKVLAINRSGLTSINLSNNTLLEALTLDDNQLSEIDVSNNTELTLFDTNDNQLESLSIENNSKIISLSCLYNNITSFSLPENSDMDFLIVSGNPMEDLDITNGEVLTYLGAGETSLSQLDVSQNVKLVICTFISLGTFGYSPFDSPISL